MTQAKLQTVTLKTFANYRHAAERAVRAYRAGGHRLIAVVQKGVDQAAVRGAEPYVPALAAAIRRAGDNMGQLAVRSVDALSAGTERAIELGSAGVNTQVKRVAELVGGVDNAIVANGLKAAVRVSLPGAQVALALSERIAAGADKLAAAAAGPRSAVAKAAAPRKAGGAPKTTRRAAAPVKAAPRRAKAAASKAVAPVQRAARKPVAKPVVKAAAKPVRRASRAAKPVVQAAQPEASASAA